MESEYGEDQGTWPSTWPMDLRRDFESRNRTDEQWHLMRTLPVEAVKCFVRFWDTPYPEGLHCNSTWDSFICWPTTAANRSVHRSCTEIIELLGHETPPEEFSAFRICDVNGRWKWGKTNYNECLPFLFPDPERAEERKDAEVLGYIMFVGSILSFFALIICLFIFSYFKSLKCDRVTVHKHLAASSFIRVILNIIMTEPIISGRETFTYTDINWLCKVILVAKMYTALTSVNWMFIEGLYLHSRLVTSVFSQQTPFRIYYFLGWGVPCVLVTAWAVALNSVMDTPCWNGYRELSLIWILAVPMYIALAINLLFLINIIRILVTKLRASVAIETDQARKAMKATLVLFPLLGLPNLFVGINPQDQGDLEDVYLFTNAILESSQGIFLSVLYCFTNNEVHEAILKEYSRYWLRMHPQCDNKRRRSSRSVHLLQKKFNLEVPKRPFWSRWAVLYQRTSDDTSNGNEETTEEHQECIL